MLHVEITVMKRIDFNWSEWFEGMTIRHTDQDELFLVYSGTISLESDWGTVILRPGELAVIPKGLGHRSSALMRSHVLLVKVFNKPD